MGRHRGGRRKAHKVRPRYARIAAAGSAMLVTLVAVLGATGILPTKTGSAPAYAGGVREAAGSVQLSGSVVESLPRRPSGESSSRLPEDSGHGRRIVFDISGQRVWLVGAHDKVLRTYLVSGSLTDNLAPGVYAVYSKSRHAVGVDDSGTMEYMVRFAHGARAAIGFHDIPVFQGEPVQTRAELGTPQSHGCIRQARVDARALWNFAPVGAKVVVLA